MWTFYIDSVLILLNVLAYASMLPRGDKHSSAAKSQSPATLPQHLSSQGSYRSQQLSVMSADAMIKRDDEESDDLRITRIDIKTLSIPIPTAAHSLEMFYNAILFNALAPWCTQPPQQALVMSMGPLQLTMNIAFDNGVPQGIPWPFVRNFARNMLAMTARGFTGTYDMFYMRGDFQFSPDSPPLGVEVRLRIVLGM